MWFLGEEVVTNRAAFAADKDDDVPRYSANEVRQMLKGERGRCANEVMFITHKRIFLTRKLRLALKQGCLNATGEKK